jgi:hypothetical protein
MSKHLPPSHQGDWPQLTKFDKLRIKTEMQLAQLINTELNLGIRDARQALKSADTWAVVEECSRRANRAYTKIARLIPLVVEITEDERSKVESRLEGLQGMLEALSAIGSNPTPAEEEIAALARAGGKRLPRRSTRRRLVSSGAGIEGAKRTERSLFRELGPLRLLDLLLEQSEMNYQGEIQVSF